MAEAKYPKGINAKNPRQGAPDYQIAQISIKRVDAINWLNEQSEEWINLDLKRGKEDKFYLQVNEWKPNL